jgi:hypothetical protein
MDVLGAAGCQGFIEAAAPTHPSLIDQHHRLAELFGVINIPSSIWIDEQGMIVRPAEVAPAPPLQRDSPAMDIPAELPQRFMDIMGEAAKMAIDPADYHAALRDWVQKGAASDYAMDAATVIQRSRPRSADVSLGHAHFELATHLEIEGHHLAAIKHFREAHRLVPDSWTFRRQAWSLEGGVEGPLNRFWQGPSTDNPDAWPYAGDWLEDVRAVGAENYNDPWRK